ncbi:MAG: inositol monophosphatase [Clostridia bacterium]|nr:inositol monophosphatase [Clostridia bacterium]
MDFERIIELVKNSGRMVKNLAHDEYNTRLKGQSDFVTAADIAVSKYLKKELKSEAPHVGFLSEEEGGRLTDPCWILDPVDGTANLVYGLNMSSVSLGLYVGGRVVFGVVYNPFSGECFTAEEGKGAFLNNSRIAVSKRDISQSIVEFGAGSTHKENADISFAVAKDIFMHCVDIRRICSSALDLCFIASGRIDGYFEFVLKPWDVAAGSLILSEAGGRITDMNGRAIDLSRKTSVVASNGVIHDYLLNTISQNM